nr:MAG TPA: hypothetical protein [Caudoviricetes sp.]
MIEKFGLREKDLYICFKCWEEIFTFFLHKFCFKILNGARSENRPHSLKPFKKNSPLSF